MAQIVSLELVFDDVSDAAVRAEWEALAAAGLPSQAQHKGASNMPHVTVLVRPQLPTFSDIAAAELTAALPVRVTFGAPVLFGAGRSRVIARSVVPTRDLLALHARVHELAGPGGDLDHTRPGAWTAHVTLARRVRLERIGEALGVLADAGVGDIEAQAVGIRRWDAETRTISTVAGRGTLEQC